jgi:hypothetical protein
VVLPCLKPALGSVPSPNCICRGVRHSASNTEGDPTTTHMHFARDVATLNRFGLYKNSIPRGASAWLDVVMHFDLIVAPSVEIFKTSARG